MSLNDKSKHHKRKKHTLFLVLQLFLVAVALIGILAYYVSGLGSKISRMKRTASDIVASANDSTFKVGETSIVYDDSGKEISRLIGEMDVYYLTFDEIPSNLKDAVITMEDKKFLDHEGVDYLAIVRALYEDIKSRSWEQGGSTITQQLAKTMFLSSDKTWERKVTELFISVGLERKFSKAKILEYYVNNIYYANGYYGIQAAAHGYFDKTPRELTLSEAAFLTAIPNNPATYDPLIHFESTLSRRNLILENMLLDGKISEEQCKAAKAEDIVFKRPTKSKNDYQETFAYYCATKILMELDGFEFCYDFESDEERREYNRRYDEAYSKWNATLFNAGYRIYTSLNTRLQSQLQNAVDSNLLEFDEVNDEGIYTLQGSAACIDNSTGQIVAIVGGRSQEHLGYSLNRAYQSYRQPGSSIKPLLVYTPALEREYTPDTIVEDVYKKGGPKNAGGVYGGSITLREAVMYSRNVVAWNIFDALTPQVGLKYLKNMDFNRIVDMDYVPAASLGGLTYGCSAVEMAKGFATLANDGYYRNPDCIDRITDSTGKLLYKRNRAEEKQIYEIDAARMMTDMLISVGKSGTAKKIKLDGQTFAAKTGTTTASKDGWLCGYTPYYTCAVWVGFDLPKELNDLQGATYPANIWKSFMGEVHAGLENKEFNLNVTTTIDTKPKIDDNISYPAVDDNIYINENDSEVLIIR